MELVVKNEGIRIDKYLSEEIDYSRELITKMLKDGYILVNGRIVKPSYKTKVNDKVFIDEEHTYEQDINPVEMPLNIV